MKHTRENQQRPARGCNAGQLAIRLGNIREQREDYEHRLRLLNASGWVGKEAKRQREEYRSRLERLDHDRMLCERWLDVRRAEEASAVNHVMGRYGE